MEKHSRSRTLFFIAAAGLCVGWTILAWAQSPVVSDHPALNEQEQLVPCASCHQEVTPAIHQQWYDSVHGLAMVKCYQCHGTFENFAVTPSIDNCATCHAAMVSEDHSGNKLCWECHAPHLFKDK